MFTEPFEPPPDRYFDDEPEPDEPVAAPAGDSLSALLRLILAGSETPDEIAAKVLLLGAAVGHPCAPKTCRAMALRMGVSHTTAARRLTAFKRSLQQMNQFRRDSVTHGHRVE